MARFTLLDWTHRDARTRSTAHRAAEPSERAGDGADEVGPAPRRALMPPELPSFRDIESWLSVDLAGGL